MYAFELEGLEPEDGRLVLTGHWSGVRGLRFMRPTLIVDGREVLATLEHKPWAPMDDRPWTAAFPWSGGPVDAKTAMLAVAPSITVPLSGGTAAPPAVRRSEEVRERLDDERVRNERLGTEVRFLRERLATVTAEAERTDAAAAGERDRALDVARAEVESLRSRLAEAERARDAARRERDAAVEQRDEILRDREAAVRTRDRAAADRDAAVRERDAALDERDAAIARRDDALRHREDALVASRTLERRLRTELARGTEGSDPRVPDGAPGTDPPAPRHTRQSDFEARFIRVDGAEGSDPTAPRGTEGSDPGVPDQPIGVRHVPLTRAEPTLGHERAQRWQPTTLDLWVARGLGGMAALCFLLLLITLLFTLT